jgi:hypothetical protein
MNIAEILRGLADKMDSIQGSQAVPHQDQRAELHQVEPSNDENPDINTDSMVSPLQQKLELLKKAAGVDNAYDDGEQLAHGHEGGCTDCGCDPCECGDEDDELSVMKRNAGLPVLIQMTSDSNDIEG